MTELIQLQTWIGEALRRRFEKPLCFCFSDVVGSTAYFARFGDAAGRGLQQLHFDLLNQVLPAAGGRGGDTAGGGGGAVFPTVEAATDAVIKLQNLISEQNATRSGEHQLAVRVGVH